MEKPKNNHAQAALELAIFGAILIFILGTIVRTATSSAYTQNQNFKAMRMAMLASWQGAWAGTVSRNSASILFLEDRLSPDAGKYGALDRNPFIAQGSGTFTFQLQYPVDPTEVYKNLPMMDVYINGQYFPFTTAGFTAKPLTRPASCDGAAGSCAQNQCLRNQREWSGGIVTVGQFNNIVPLPSNLTPTQGLSLAQTQNNLIMSHATAIFQELSNEGVISLAGGTNATAYVNVTIIPSTFSGWFATTFGSISTGQILQMQNILKAGQYKYKLFYSQWPNGTPQFSATTPPNCALAQQPNNALCSSLTMPDAQGGTYINNNVDMQFDLKRLGDYQQVEKDLPPVSDCSDPNAGLRCSIAWQWQASAATSATAIGLNTQNNQYVSADIDGRLSEVTIYAMAVGPDGTPSVSYEDPAMGDIDGSWSIASCGPKPGLQSNAQIFTFTKDGTYLEMKEGKLYNPENGQFVRSANKRDTIDLIQRIVQLSSNTKRFCDDNGNRAPSVGLYGQPTTGGLPIAVGGVVQNPVEVCIPANATGNNNCFSSETNIKSTCFDATDKKLFVRSRVEDLRGRFWLTDVQGQLKVQ